MKRDWKRPWSIILYLALPLAMSLLMALVFGGNRGNGPAPTLHLAILDQDHDLLSRFLRSMPSQGEAAQRLRLHFVETTGEGLHLIEKDEVSALVILPTNMTVDLLDEKSNSIEFYANPSQQALPKVAWQGVSILADGLSAASSILHEPLQEFRALSSLKEFPEVTAVTDGTRRTMESLRGIRAYLFPPLIRFKTIASSDLLLDSTNAVTPPKSP